MKLYSYYKNKAVKKYKKIQKPFHYIQVIAFITGIIFLALSVYSIYDMIIANTALMIIAHLSGACIAMGTWISIRIIKQGIKGE